MATIGAVMAHAFCDAGSGRSEIETAPAGLLLVLALGDPYLVGVGTDGRRPMLGGFVIGAQSGFGTSALDGTAEGVQVHLPWPVAAAVLGPVLSDLADQAVACTDLDGGADVVDQLSSSLVDDRGRVVAQWLRALRASHSAPSPTTTRALVRIDQGVASVGALATELGCSRGHLHRAVRAATGQSPSTLIRVARLHRLIRLRARSGLAPSLAQAATQVGFTDHAHLCHEARRFAGRTPTTWPTIR